MNCLASLEDLLDIFDKINIVSSCVKSWLNYPNVPVSVNAILRQMLIQSLMGFDNQVFEE